MLCDAYYKYWIAVIREDETLEVIWNSLINMQHHTFQFIWIKKRDRKNRKKLLMLLKIYLQVSRIFNLRFKI